MSQMTVSVVTCSYTLERLEFLKEAVESVLSQSLKPLEVTIAVDRNEELFGTLRTALPPGVSIILNQGVGGVSETRNLGVRASKGDLIACIDDDAVAESKWLENLAKPFDDPRVVAVGGRAIPHWLAGKRPGWFAEELDWVVGCTYKGLPVKGSEFVRNMFGCNMAFRKSTFERGGFFVSKLGRVSKLKGVGEEADICLRIRDAIPGALIVYAPEAVIHHKVPSWRTRPAYLIRRSYDEGFYKTIVRRLSPSGSGRPLAVENAYLRYLLLTAIPQRLGRFYRPGALAELAAILASMTATGVGYLQGTIVGPSEPA